MRTKLTLCAVFALSALLGGCEDTRTTEFCGTICECQGDPNDVATCTNQCAQSIDALESSNTGEPIVTDECFACVSSNTCEVAGVVCTTECASFIQALNNTPQPGDPIDTTN